MEAKELRDIRISLNISQREMAKRLYTDLRTYQRWEYGDARIKGVVRKAVEGVFNDNRNRRNARINNDLATPSLGLRRIANAGALPGFREVIDALKMLAREPNHKNAENAQRIAERAQLNLGPW